MIRTTIRAPGTIQLDERRISVIAMRSESFVLKVADVTTGSHVVKGQPLDGSLQSRGGFCGRRIPRHHHLQDDRRRRHRTAADRGSG